MNLFGSNSKASSRNSSFLLSKKASLSINTNAPPIQLPQMSNTELFLRHRTETYLTNLDSDTATKLLELMTELNVEDDVTFLFSTHDPLVMGYAARQVLLRDGEIADEQRTTPQPA